jgi:hypothetical protein
MYKAKVVGTRYRMKKIMDMVVEGTGWIGDANESMQL